MYMAAWKVSVFVDTWLQRRRDSEPEPGSRIEYPTNSL